ncbi:MAG: S1 RNA-binding domain-containing protein [Candidatus Harrisonbacteria bacterium]|nr:S1 RNA-binding domain-containing protein [Candidatus Harrisonbacteria bacterium]MBI2406298.1 S1 RNA-binding domain-containing protein [Candidatus Harrisonbacteria bacterium]
MPISIPKKLNSPLTQLLKTDPGLLAILKHGDLVEAAFLSKETKAAYFDLGRFGIGTVYGAEFSNAAEAIKALNPGDKVSAKVVDPENDEGYIELSLAEAGKQRAWQDIKNLLERGEIMTVKITAANSGGLIAPVNDIKAFLPVSQLTPDHYPHIEDGDKGKILEELKKFIGQELKVKIIDLNTRTNKLIISERETMSTNVKELLEKYKTGDVIDGIVSGVADFGAFVRFADNPDIEGLVHISELSHRLIENPKEIVKVNDSIKAKILEIKDGRVSLSLKALQEDPWLKVPEKYKDDTDVSGTVTKFNPFGAFVALDADIQGLIHVSEFGGVDEMKKQLELGHAYTFHIAMVKPAEKRIILKLKK